MESIYKLSPTLSHAVYVVFGGYDRRPFARLRKARAFIAVDPLFERSQAPRLCIVEFVIQCADQLREDLVNTFAPAT